MLSPRISHPLKPNVMSAVRSGPDSVLFRKYRFLFDCLFIHKNGPTRSDFVVYFNGGRSHGLRSDPIPSVSESTVLELQSQRSLNVYVCPPLKVSLKDRIMYDTWRPLCEHTFVCTVNTFPQTSGPFETVIGDTCDCTGYVRRNTRERAVVQVAGSRRVAHTVLPPAKNGVGTCWCTCAP